MKNEQKKVIETDVVKVKAISFENASGKVITLTYEAVEKLLNEKKESK